MLLVCGQVPVVTSRRGQAVPCCACYGGMQQLVHADRQHAKHAGEQRADMDLLTRLHSLSEAAHVPGL